MSSVSSLPCPALGCESTQVDSRGHCSTLHTYTTKGMAMIPFTHLVGLCRSWPLRSPRVCLWHAIANPPLGNDVPWIDRHPIPARMFHDRGADRPRLPCPRLVAAPGRRSSPIRQHLGVAAYRHVVQQAVAHSPYHEFLLVLDPQFFLYAVDGVPYGNRAVAPRLGDLGV